MKVVNVRRLHELLIYLSLADGPVPPFYALKLAYLLVGESVSNVPRGNAADNLIIIRVFRYN